MDIIVKQQGDHMESIGERLKEERKRTGVTQEYFAGLGGVTVQTQRRYEAGGRSPDANYFAAIAHTVDVQYIITGERSLRPQSQASIVYAATHGGEPLRISDETRQPEPAPLDQDRLRQIVEVVEDTAGSLSAAKRASLIVALYMMRIESPEEMPAALRVIVAGMES